MIAAVLALALCAEPIELASPSFTGDKLTPEQLQRHAAFFGNRLRAQGIKVSDAPQKPDGLVEGHLVALGEGAVMLDLRVMLLGSDRPAAVRSLTAHGEAELQEAMRRLAQELAAELFSKLGRAPVPQIEVALPPPTEEPRSMLPSGAVVLGGVLAVGAAVPLFYAGNGQAAEVRRNALGDTPDGQAQVASAMRLTTTASVLLAVGGAALLGGSALAIVTSHYNAKLEASAWLAPGQGGGLAVSGSFP